MDKVQYLTAQQAKETALKAKEKVEAEKVAVEKQVKQILAVVARKAALGEVSVVLAGCILKDSVLILKELGYAVNVERSITSPKGRGLNS